MAGFRTKPVSSYRTCLCRRLPEIPREQPVFRRPTGCVGLGIGRAARLFHISVTDLCAGNQGLTGKLTMYAQAPNSSTQITILRGLGKKIGYQREYFDGAQGGVEHPGEHEQYKDEQLEATRINSDYYGQLNWNTLYKTVAIKEKSRVDDEEVYVVIKTPEKGSAVTDYISTKSFLLVKREDAGVETIYSDYRNVDGEMVPFVFVMQTAIGRIAARVEEVKFNTRIPASTFRAASK